jgi:hypothetical protein
MKAKILSNNKKLSFFYINCTFFNSCNGKLPGADARKFPADPKKELKKI